LEKDVVQGCVSGSRSRGRQRRRWTEDIVDWTGLDINTAARLTEDRHRWHGSGDLRFHSTCSDITTEATSPQTRGQWVTAVPV